MDKKSPACLVKKILDLIKEALKNVDYTNSICWIFGITDIPEQTALFSKLLQYHEEYQKLSQKMKYAQKRGLLCISLNLEDNVKKFEQIVEQTRIKKDIWKNGPVRVLCSETKLLHIALEVKEKGHVHLNKAGIDSIFDFSRVVSFWNRIPTYTTFLLGGGLAVSSPEFELFAAMGWAYNEAVKTSQEMTILKEQLGKPDENITAYGDTVGVHSMMCRQALINAFLLIEAFINSITEASLRDESNKFTAEQRLYLQEQTKDRNGQIRQRFVPIEDKLYEWTRILSPTGATFNKGSNPFQNFMRIKEYRDSIVHLAAPKVKSFRSIDFKVASKAVLVALEMIKLISEYTAPDSNNIEYPFWYGDPHADGFFHISRKLETQIK
jgi:hypothetical protein